MSKRTNDELERDAKKTKHDKTKPGSTPQNPIIIDDETTSVIDIEDDDAATSVIVIEDDEDATDISTITSNCPGCQIDHPSQVQHMGPNGCLGEY